MQFGSVEHNDENGMPVGNLYRCFVKVISCVTQRHCVIITHYSRNVFVGDIWFYQVCICVALCSYITFLLVSGISHVPGLVSQGKLMLSSC